MSKSNNISAAKRIRFRLEATAVLGLFRLLSWLPIDVASAIPGKLLRWIAPLTSRHRRALNNIQRILPELSAHEAKQIALDNWENMGRILGEMPHLEAIIDNPERFKVNNLSIGEQIASSDKGAVVICGHFGNWELSSGITRRLQKRQLNYYRSIANPYLDEALYNIRKKMVPHGDLVPKGGRGLRIGMKQLAKGNFVGMMVDQREDEGMDVPFMGEMAKTSQASALLALRYDVPIIAGVVFRENGAHFRMEIEEIPVQRSDDFQSDIRQTMLNINDRFGDWVKDDPKQWLWSHRRW